MKLPKRPKREPSQAQIDKKFADLTSSLDDTDFYLSGPRDYQLNEEYEEENRFTPPQGAELDAKIPKNRKMTIFIICLLSLFVWFFTAMFFPHLATWQAWLGVLLVIALALGILLLASPGRSHLHRQTYFSDEDGAQL